MRLEGIQQMQSILLASSIFFSFFMHHMYVVVFLSLWLLLLAILLLFHLLFPFMYIFYRYFRLLVQFCVIELFEFRSFGLFLLRNTHLIYFSLLSPFPRHTLYTYTVGRSNRNQPTGLFLKTFINICT